MSDLKYLTVPHLTRNEMARIFSKISVNKETGCWEWQGSLAGKGARVGRGYGKIFWRGLRESAHRFIYAWLVEPIPRGFSRDIPVLDHIVCNNTICCNPAHLKLVTQQANIMRGEGACANNAKKTHCPYGHLLPTEPDMRYGTARRCAVCMHEKRHRPDRGERKREYDRKRRERLRLMRQGGTPHPSC